jgi:ELP3 family radical SAM enzyme/protein acetyltransferase
MADIEDIIKPFWFKNISESNINKSRDFLDDYYFNDCTIKKLNKIKENFVIYQSKNEFGGILKFGALMTIYKLGRLSNHYPTAKIELESKLKVKNVREGSGVMVFTIFTSAFPTHTIIDENGNEKIVNESGMEVTDETNVGQFTCKYNCSFCPTDPKMPKSYIATEPGVARAVLNDFDPVKQIIDRGSQFLQMGHCIDKIELLILGGTWDSFSVEYRREFVRDIYWTFNIFMDWLFYDDLKAEELIDPFIFKDKKKLRKKESLENEIIINETACCRVIGLTPETRPDQINASTITFLREIGATRVQLGIQHLDDDILRYNNRNCYTKDTIRAIQMLKDNGIKVDAHLMFDLPTDKYTQEEMPIIDRNMFIEFNTNPSYKVDQLKLYPCVVTEHTLIKEWYDNGVYKPYGETITPPQDIWRKMTVENKMEHRLSNPLYKNMLLCYSEVHSSIRVNRIIRDIPTNEIFAGTTQTGMRSEIDNDMKLLGLSSKDIRFREAGSYRFINVNDAKEPIMKELSFESSKGTEYFLSWESNDEHSILYSFLRLRLSKNSGKTQTGKIIFPELVRTALIRELHTYGKVMPCKENKKYYTNGIVLLEEIEATKYQHKGFGKKLLKRAEQIALNNGYNKIAVTAGVGVREYYRKQGYIINSKKGCYQIKMLNKYNIYYWIVSFLFLILSVLIVLYKIIHF